MYNLLLKYTGRLYEAEGVQGAGGGAEGAHPVAAPWAGVTDGAWKIGEGDKASEWWNTIPEPEAREHVKAKGYKNPAELALANYSLTKLQRGATDVLAIPGPNATQNDWDAFYTKMGRPATKDDYKLEFGENVKVDDRMVGFGKELFHEMGLDNTRANKAAAKWNAFVEKMNADTLAETQAQNAKEMQELEASWGADINANKAAGERVMKSLGLSDEKMAKIEGAIGQAAIVELLAMIGKKSAEGPLIGGGNNGDPNDPANMSKEQAQAKIAQLDGDVEFQKKYTDAKHPGHAEAVDYRLRLFAKAG